MKSVDVTKWREKRGLSQSELAKLLDMHVITINRWENEARDIPALLPLALEALAARLDAKAKTKAPSQT